MALLEDLRAASPRLQSASDEQLLNVLAQQPEYQGLSDGELKAVAYGQDGAPEENEPGFGAGVAAGVDQLQAMGGGLLMAAGEKAGSEDAYEAGKGIYDRNMEEAQENALGYGFTDLFSDPDTSSWQWAKYTAGNLLPTMATAAAGGGVGGVGARMLAGSVAKRAATQAGQAIGAYGASAGMETGAIMGETDDADVALAHGSVAGALDALPIMRALRKVGGNELADKAASEISDSALSSLKQKAGQSLKGATGKGALTQALAETSTEGLQTLIEQHANYWVDNNGESLLSNLGEANWKEIVDASAAGALGGGVMGAPAGLAERGQARRALSNMPDGSQSAEAGATEQGPDGDPDPSVFDNANVSQQEYRDSWAEYDTPPAQRAQRRKEQAIAEARQQTADAGGDALQQAQAAQQAEQMAEGVNQEEQAAEAPRQSAEIGNRIQLAMNAAEDMEPLANGTEQGKTRLRNMNAVLQRAESAYADGNIELANRLTGRAEMIGRNLTQSLNRQGSRERPATGTWERAAPFGGRLGQDSAGRLNAPDDVIYGEGPTADTTQYDAQARSVRRDERMQAQRQGAERMRANVAEQRPQIPDQGIVYGDGPIAGNANTGMDQPVQRPRFTDTGARGNAESQRAEMERQAQRVAELERTRGPSETTYLPENTPIQTRYRVMDAAELTPSNTPDGQVNARYPRELQPRDRTNANSQVQVRNIAANLNPERLGRSTDAATGAPIVGPDGVVESGNGRTMAISQAYEQGNADGYRQHVMRQARDMGMDTEAVAAMDRPVLVRERSTNVDRADFARRANESTVAGMTAYEQAQADADALTTDDIQRWAPDQSGDPLAASNRDFMRRFVQQLGNNEAARYTTRDGQASPELGQRMQRAVFAKAYRDSDMVEMVTEQGDAMRNLSAALQVAAPDIALARDTGNQDALTTTDTINDAVRIVRRARQNGVAIRELVNQGDAFSQSPSPLTADLALFMNANMRSRQALADAMRYIGQATRQRAEGARNGALFEDTTTNRDVIDEGFRQADTPQRSATPDVSGRDREGESAQSPDRAEGAQAGQQDEAVDDAPLLDTYTEQDIAERERARQQAEQKGADQRQREAQRAQADTEANDFRLAGSNRPADVATAGGQQDLTDAETSPRNGQSREDRIEDFGEKIGGARKDQARQILSGLNDEADTSSTLSEAFPAPNYSKLVEEGTDPRAAALVAVLRASIPSKPRRGLRLQQWVKGLNSAREMARQVLDGSMDIDAAFQAPASRRYRQLEGALRTAEIIAPLKPSLYTKAAKWRVDAEAGFTLYNGQPFNPNQTVYMLKDPRGRDTGVWETDFEQMRSKAANVITRAVENDGSKPRSRQTKIDVYRDTRTGERFLGFKNRSTTIRLRSGFESVKEAVDYLDGHRDELQAQIDSMRRGPRMRRGENSPRIGDEVRDGDVTPEQFQEAFGFRGVEFGNYVEGQRRQADLNQAHDALMDLATTLGVPPHALSLDGTLGLAFGARGKGGRGAPVAHYESGRVVINLTKTEGPGSLAHEWFHALDNFIPGGQGARNYQTDLTTDGPARVELAERWREMRKALKDSGFEKRSKEFDVPRSKPYYGTPIEMAARAFERYTRDKMMAEGNRNDYLVNIDKEGGAYPTDAEMRTIKPALDRLLGTLEHRDTTRGVELYAMSAGGEALRPAPRAEDIRQALKGNPELSEVNVIQSSSELPPEALLGMLLRDVNPQEVAAMYNGGDLYVIADNVDSTQEAVRYAVHEAVGHKGIRAVLGEDLDPVMRQLYKTLPLSKKGREALNEVLESYSFLDRNNANDQITIGQEMVAHLLEKGYRPKAWQRAVAKIRELLRRAFPGVGWTYTDVLALGERSRDYLRRQQAERQGEDVQLYSLRGKQRYAFETQFDDFTDADRDAAAKIGARTPPQRAMEWFKEKADRASLKIRQGMVDRYAAFREMDEQLYGESAMGENIQRSSWVLARMSNAANGALHAMLHNGRIRLDPEEKIIQLQEGDAKGLGEVLGRLGSAAEIERFMGWIAGNRAARLAEEGRENLFDAGDIGAMKDWNRGTLDDGRSRDAVYQEVFAEFQQYRDDVLAVAEQSGIISKEQREMWAEEFYVPFYRLSEDNGGSTGQLATNGLSRQQAYKKLKGGTDNLNDLLQNTMMNFHHLMDASLKNQAASQAVENAKAMGMAEVVPESNRDTTTSTFVMENGKKVFYQIDDPLVFEALTALAHPGMNSSIMKVMRGFKRVFTNLTTTTPQFMVANLIRDSLQATATNNVSKNAFKNVINGAGAYRDQRLRAQMLASGASFRFGHLYGNNPDELRSQLTRNMRDAKIVDGPSGVPDALRAGWAWWNDVNDATENVNRAAIYSQNREGGELRAAFESRDLIDFSAHGAWPAVRVLIDIVPFLNARIQGLDKIYRSGVKPGASVMAEAFGKGKAGVRDKQAAARFWTVAGTLTAATIALYLHNRDDEEYQKLEDWQKDTYWFFRVGDQGFFIPKPFEVGAIATMAERITEQFADDEATGKLFSQRMIHMVTDTFSFSPVPQMMQPALDVYANYDAFTGRPIESMGMERLSPELRKRSSTSKAAEWISGALNSTLGAVGSADTNPFALSPVQVDHLIGGYLGQVGTWAASSGDVAWRVATGKESPAQHWYEYQPVRRFYQNLGNEDRYTKYGTIFYEGLREASRAYSDMKELREMNQLEEAAELAESKRDMLALRKPLNRAQSRMNTLNKRIDLIRRSNVDGELKRQRIDRLRAIKNQIQQTLAGRITQARSN
ncbi:LPD38 domain-containing protein [Chromohalobacter canadensis]|uniref:LPD38 domain-containing protein n=1 Tax=Chromohalobacter canadensis TaxID=141389 RepID=UPI00240F0754|nr:LPD38 domain-containing protein [Chromohalobacter canadensis]